MAEKTIVDPKIVFGLQKELLKRIDAAYNKNDQFFFDSMNAFLKLSKEEKEKIVEEKLGIKTEQLIFEKFTPTDIIVSTAPSGKTYNLAADRRQLICTKAEGGLFDWVDLDIESLFGDITFTDDKAVSGRVQLFNQVITHGDIIAEGEHLRVYQEYDIVQGLLLANELVKAGAIEKRGYGVLIYLKNRNHGDHYHLRVFRSDDGKLGVHVFEVILDFVWDAGNGILFDN